MAIATGAILVLLIVGLDMLKNQGRNIQTIMTQLEMFKDLLLRLEAATTNIAADIKRLADQVAAGGLTEKEEIEISEALKAAAEKLEEVASITPEPPVDPPVEG